MFPLDINSTQNDCTLHTVDSLNIFYANDLACKFFVLHQNIRSFNKNIDTFLLLMKSVNLTPDVIIFSETFFTDSNIQNLPGYNGFHSHRETRNEGGVSVYVLDKYISDYVHDMCFVTDQS